MGAPAEGWGGRWVAVVAAALPPACPPCCFDPPPSCSLPPPAPPPASCRFLTDTGIEFLREFLNLPSEIVPATLKKSTRPLEREGARPPRRDGPPRDGPPRRGGGEREGYRSDKVRRAGLPGCSSCCC